MFAVTLMLRDCYPVEYVGRRCCHLHLVSPSRYCKKGPVLTTSKLKLSDSTLTI